MTFARYIGGTRTPTEHPQHSPPETRECLTCDGLGGWDEAAQMAPLPTVHAWRSCYVCGGSGVEPDEGA